jgi:lauroyl/myristoyl acyltransferase
MRLQDLTSHPRAIRLGLSIAKHTPHWLGYGIARWAARFIACAKPRIYWTVRANLHQALGPETDRRTLHRLSREVFFHAAKTYYDHFHAFTHGDDTVRAMIHMTEEDLANLKRAQSSGRGVMLATGHLSAFDLAGLVLALYGIKLQGLSLRDPIDGFKLLNLMRIQGGIQATPVQVTSLREAIRRLRQGGLVGTGVDRPIGHGDEPVEFFGKTALLPTGHIRLALRTDAIVVIGYCEYDPDTGYRLRVEPPMELVRTGDRDEDVRVNARRVLKVLERAILAHPEQWLLFVPVWPDGLQGSST